MAVPPDSRFISAGRFETKDGWHLQAHLHPFHEMIAVVSGRHHVAIRGRHVVATPGELLLYPSGIAHEEWAEPGVHFEIVFIAFEWPGLGPGSPDKVKDARGRIRSVMQWLLEEQNGYYAQAAELRERFLAAALSELARAMAAPGHGIVDDVREFIRDNMPARISLDELARVARLSRFHFLRLYRGMTGRTPMEDVRRMRLEAARTLLLSTDQPLKTIAPLVGIGSEYHLSRLFRKQFGLGARELRRRVGEGAGGRLREPRASERREARATGGRRARSAGRRAAGTRPS